MLPRQRVETVAHTVELLSFVQDRIGIHGYAAFAECLKERTLQMYCLSSENLKGGAVSDAIERKRIREEPSFQHRLI
jgi:hypothetical protein